MHGGLTAAIIDETLGGLYTSLLTSGNLGMTLPGLTARLEVDYKKVSCHAHDVISQQRCEISIQATLQFKAQCLRQAPWCSIVLACTSFQLVPLESVCDCYVVLNTGPVRDEHKDAHVT